MFKPKIGDLVWIWPLGYLKAFPGLIIGERRIRDREIQDEELAEVKRNPLLNRHLGRLEYQILYEEKIAWASTGTVSNLELSDKEFAIVAPGDEAWHIITEWFERKP